MDSKKRTFILIKLQSAISLLLLVTPVSSQPQQRPHFMSVDCKANRCYGLYPMRRTWDEAAARCLQDGWTGLALPDRADLEALLGQYALWMSDEMGDDDGYSAWIGGHEVIDRDWKWPDGTTLQQKKAGSARMTLKLSAVEKEFENCVELSVNRTSNSLLLSSRMCRTMLKYFICQQTATVNVSSVGASCKLNGTAGVRVGGSCFAVFSGTAVKSTARWSAGVASWFKANSHCHALGASLASLTAGTQNLTADVLALADYLATNVTAAAGEAFWIGLARNPWVWVDEYDPDTSSLSHTQPIYYSDWLEPDQPNKERMDCMSIGANDRRYGWSSQRCQIRLPFFCENRTAIATTASSVAKTTESVRDVSGVTSGDANAFTSEETLTVTTATDVNTTAEARTVGNYTTEAVIAFFCILGVSILLAIAFVAYWFIRLRRRGGYTPQP